MMYKRVTISEFNKFIKEYPRPLEYDFFMDYGSYHDFIIGKGWDSIVCRINLIAQNNERKYEIKIN